MSKKAAGKGGKGKKGKEEPDVDQSLQPEEMKKQLQGIADKAQDLCEQVSDYIVRNDPCACCPTTCCVPCSSGCPVPCGISFPCEPGPMPPLCSPCNPGCVCLNSCPPCFPCYVNLCEVHPLGKFIKLENSSCRKYEYISRFYIVQMLGPEVLSIYKFPPLSNIPPQCSCKVWSASCDPGIYKVPADQVNHSICRWFAGPDIVTVFCRPEGHSVSWLIGCHGVYPLYCPGTCSCPCPCPCP